MATVLFVDDHMELCAINSAFLSQHGYSVVTAGDGEAALRAAREHHPDVIVLDHSLPLMNGVDVARELKSDPSTAGIPILMLTACAYGAVGSKAREAGCAGFLAKPCPPRRVLAEVQRFSTH